LTAASTQEQRAHRARRRPTLRGCAVALALGALAGCSATPEPVATEAALPASFSRSGEADRVDRWWTAFDDPALNRLIDTALADRPQLRATWARLVQAQAVAGRTRADRWPSLDGTGEAQVQDGDDLPEMQESYALGLSASYEVDLWGRVDARADAANLDAQAARRELQAAALSLSGEVADTWYRLVAQRARLDLLQRQLETNQTVERVVEVRVRQGQAQLADLLRQRELIERTREQISNAEGELELLRSELQVLLGRAPGAGIELPDSRALPAGPALPATGVPAELLQRRPDVREAVLRVQAADKRVAAAVAERYPRIDLTASLRSSAERPSDLFSTWLASLAGQLAVPLFDAGRRAAEVDRSEAVVAERLAQFEDTALTAIREVEDALSRARQQRRRVDSLDRQVELARQSIQRLRGRYVNGATDFLDVLDALTRVQELERELIEARRARLAARIALARALAGGIDLPAPEGRGFEALETWTEREAGTAPAGGGAT
jgi:NodT family efflux transporter outer membrane factor (OMF) lipoprotein